MPPALAALSWQPARACALAATCPSSSRLYHGKPLLRHSIEAFAALAARHARIIVVIGEGQQALAEAGAVALRAWSSSPAVPSGGIPCGWACSPSPRPAAADRVFIHDAARPASDQPGARPAVCRAGQRRRRHPRAAGRRQHHARHGLHANPPWIAMACGAFRRRRPLPFRAILAAHLAWPSDMRRDR